MINRILLTIILIFTLSSCGGGNNSKNTNENINTNAPGVIQVSGESVIGQQLTATISDENGLSNTEIIYQWVADDTNISNANLSTLLLTENELGKVITLVVEYVDEDGFSNEIIYTIPSIPINAEPAVIISGENQVGQKLTALVSLNNVQLSYEWYADNEIIIDATSSSIIITEDQINKIISVSVSYISEDGENNTLSSVASEAVTPTDNLGTVDISGTPLLGNTLLATPFDDDIIDIDTILYQWHLNGTPINNETSSSFIITNNEIGQLISVSVTYTDGAGFNNTVDSTAIQIETENTVTITGIARVGERLNSIISDGNGIIESSTSFQWKADDIDISGANSSSVILTNNEANKTITLLVSYTDNTGVSNTLSSPPSLAVTPANSIGNIVISGIAKSGETLTATIIDNNGLSDNTIAYQWQKNGIHIANATTSTLLITENDLAQSISVIVSYTDQDGYSDTIQSPEIKTDDIGIVAISGDVQVGQRLTSQISDNNNLAGVSFTYQWKSGGINIPGATASTLILTENEIGNYVSLFVSYTDNDGFNTNIESAQTSNVIAIDVNGIITISGLANSGGTLTSEVIDENGLSDTIINYQWLSDNTAIPNATLETLLLTDEEINKVITVTASYIDDDGYSNTTTSAQTEAVIPADQQGTVIITGFANSGGTLTATPEDENGLENVIISYQWQADGVDLSDATTATLTLTDNEIDKVITVLISYIDEDNYENSAESEETFAVIPADSTGTVTITGTVNSGGTLTANAEDDNGLEEITITYQWKSNDIDIDGAINPTLLLTDTEVGTTITVTITYTDEDGYNNTANSVETVTVVAADIAGEVSISGLAEAGQILTATPIDSNGLSNVTISYQWQANGTDIDGATSSTYELTGNDVDQAITVTVSYIDEDGYTNSAESLPTESVLLADVSGSVTISGIAGSGSTLTATPEDGNGLNDITISYQWLANETNIIDATSSTLLLDDENIGDTISVFVSYTDEDGYENTATSLETLEVIAADSSGTIVISGDPNSGSTLTTTLTDNNGINGVVIAYQWRSNGVDISDETTSTLTLTDANIGNIISISASYTDEDGYENTATSASTEEVVGADIIGTIVITGTAKASRTLTTSLEDSNGIEGSAISYQWKADNLNISNATSASLLLTEDQTGTIITVSATYTDEDRYTNTITSSATEIVAPEATLVNNTAELITALAEVSTDDLIRLAPGDYSNPGLLTIGTSGVTLSRTDEAITENTAISGEVCLHITQQNTDDNTTEADNVTLDNLLFNNVAILEDSICDTASSSDNYIMHAEAANFTLQNTTFDGEIDFPATVIWVNIEGQNSLISRNTFTNKRSDFAGAYIKLSSASSAETNYIVEYNLFSDFSSPSDSNSYAIQLGSTTGTNSINVSNNIVRYNLFDNIDVRTRVIRVQSSNNDIYGNTFANGYGMVSLENGQDNVVRSNIFIGSNSENLESGINAAPYGHTVTNNYLAGLADDSNNERAALVLTANESSTSDSGNNSLTTSGVIFSNNTIVNSQAPLLLGDKGCLATPITSAALSNNLFLNDYSPTINTELTGIAGPQSVDDGSIVDDCEHSVLTFENDHFYSDDFVNGSVDPVSRTIVGTGIITAAAPSTEPEVDENGFILGAGDDEGIGADTTTLYRILLTDVGANSTWITEINHDL